MSPLAAAVLMIIYGAVKLEPFNLIMVLAAPRAMSNV